MDEGGGRDSGVVEEPVDFHGEDVDSDEDLLQLEPRFNYERVNGTGVKKLFSNERATAIAAHDKFVIVGTHSGNIHILDHLGFNDEDNLPAYRAHRSAVTGLGIEENGRYVLSYSLDGKVVIKGILSNQLNHTVAVRYVPRCAVFCSDFCDPSSHHSFVVAERNLTLFQKGVLGYSEKVIFTGTERDGFISRCSCKGSFIAVSNEQGTFVYDRSVGDFITKAAPKHDVDRFRSPRFPPSHCWLDAESLAVAWADTLLVLTIRSIHDGNTIRRRGQITYSWRLNMFASGVSFTLGDPSVDPPGTANRGWNEIVIFGLKADQNEDADFCDTASLASSIMSSATTSAGHVLQVEVLKPIADQTSSFELLGEERITEPKISSRTTAAQVHMAALPSDRLYFLLAPGFLLAAVPRSSNDIIQWRMERGNMEGAWELAARTGDHIKTQVGREMLKQLIRSGKIVYATHRLTEVCGESVTEWEHAFKVWEEERALTLIAPVLPSKPLLPPHCYANVLHVALYNDIPLLRKLLQAWSTEQFSFDTISKQILARLSAASKREESPLSPSDEKSLYESLAQLYINEQQFELALKAYFFLRDRVIFSVIEKYRLFDLVKERISELMEIDESLTLRLLIDNEDSVPSSKIMNYLTKQPQLQIAFLNRLFARNEGNEFADQAIRLFAVHDRKRLLPFLRRAEKYDINNALDVCRSNGCIEGMIFLLGKVGNQKEALNVMIKQLSRFDMAVEFCKEHDDEELWEQLLAEVMAEPERLRLLVASAGPFLKPFRIVECLPLHLEFPGLRDALASLLADYALQVDMERGCLQATQADGYQLLSSMLTESSCASGVFPRTRCSACSRLLLPYLTDGNAAASAGDVLLFACQHAAHSSCIQGSTGRESAGMASADLSCPVCAEDAEVVFTK